MKRLIVEITSALLVAFIAFEIGAHVAGESVTSAGPLWLNTLTKPFVNFFGAHPAAVLIGVLLTPLAFFAVGLDYWCSFKLVGLKRLYPDRDAEGKPIQRPREISAQMSRLDWVVRQCEKLLRGADKLPLAGVVVGKIVDVVLPAKEDPVTGEYQKPAAVLLPKTEAAK